MHQFSIITPTYNRANYLPRIYDRLCQQDDIDFEWIIVDDGSTDNTKEVVSQFRETFEIKYIYQENAGQVSALNTGTKNTNSYITNKHDDDDILCPHVLKQVWEYFNFDSKKFKHDCACLAGLCQYETGDIIGNKFPDDYIVSDYIRYIKNNNIRGDKCEFYLTDVLRKYPFPIMGKEKNIAPSIVHIRIALSHKTLYMNKVFQEKQFLSDGLSTKNYWIMYPLGSELYCNEASVPPFSFKLQAKYSGEYIFYARLNKKKNIYKNARNKKIFLLGITVYILFCVKLFLKRFELLQNINKKIKKILNKNNQNHPKIIRE